MNKKGSIEPLDLLEIIKITLGIIILYLFFKAIIKGVDTEEVKCLCDCVNQTIKTIYLK